MKNNQLPEVRFPEFKDAWELRKLKELAKFNPKSNLPSKFEYVDLESVVGTKMVGHRTEKKDSAPSRAQRLAQKNDVFYQTVRPYQKNNYLFDLPYDNFVFSTGYAQMRPKNNGYFLLTLVQEEKFVNRVLERSTGTSYPAINSNDLAKLSVKVPTDNKEQQQIGTFFKLLDDTIALHQRKLDLLKEQKKGFLQKMFPKNGQAKPKIRFSGFTDDWELRKLSTEFEKVNERNDGSLGKEHWISVAKMYFQNPDKVQSNNIDTRTYVMRTGDIAFEGHPNKEFKFGRFVANDIGTGVVSELFPIYRHKQEYNNYYWKNAIQIERVMGPIFAKSITSSGNSSNKLDPNHFLRQQVFIPKIEEQNKIGMFFKQFDDTIALHQRELDILKNTKKAFLQKMFV